jgi:hypothetical protein
MAMRAWPTDYDGPNLLSGRMGIEAGTGFSLGENQPQ